MCGDITTLDGRDVVAAAEIVTFVEAHCIHPEVSIEFCDSPEMQPQGSFDQRASHQME